MQGMSFKISETSMHNTLFIEHTANIVANCMNYNNEFTYLIYNLNFI